MPRFISLGKLLTCIAAGIFLFHFISTSIYPDEQHDDWIDRIGLDHYAYIEHGVGKQLEKGLGQVRGGIGAIRTGLGWGIKGKQLGGLYDLVRTSVPLPSINYFDTTTAVDKFRLSSTRFVGHVVVGGSQNQFSDNMKQESRRHILITGGFGSLGKYVARDLLLNLESDPMQDMDDFEDQDSTVEDILVTILDVADKSEELNEILRMFHVDSSKEITLGTDPRAQAFTFAEHSIAHFKRTKKLRIVQGDVRDQTLMDSLFKAQAKTTEDPTRIPGHLMERGMGQQPAKIPPISGVVHLAAYNPSACQLNLADCVEVEQVGMHNILHAIQNARDTGDPDAIMPWILVPRQGEGWGDIAGNSNVLNNASRPSKDAWNIAKTLLQEATINKPLHSMIMSLPSCHSIIGNIHASRYDPIPYMVRAALGDLPIVVPNTPSGSLPFITIDDTTQMIIQGARMLELANSKEYMGRLGFVSEIEVIGPAPSPGESDTIPINHMAKTIAGMSMSRSPLALAKNTAPSDAETKTNFIQLRKKLTSVLGFSPAQPYHEAINQYIKSQLEKHDTYLSKKINVVCSLAPSEVVLEDGLMSMSTCHVQLLALFNGAYYTLGCTAGLSGQNSPLAVLTAVPYDEGVRGVEIIAERGFENHVDLKFKCPVQGKDGKLTDKSDFIVWADTPGGSKFEQAENVGERLISDWFTVNFINRDSRSFTLSLPPTQGQPVDEPRRRMTLKDTSSDAKEITFRTESPKYRPLLWKINPTCCTEQPKKKTWDFFREDPMLTSQVTFPSDDGRTTLADSTLAVQQCKALRKEHERITDIKKNFKTIVMSGKFCDSRHGKVLDWSRANDPTICQIDCDAPLTCLASRGCRCTTDRCGDKSSKGPFPGVAYTSLSSYSPKAKSRRSRRATHSREEAPNLKSRVEIIPFQSFILPAARDVYNTPIEKLPVASVIQLPETIDTHMGSKDCYDIEASRLPFLADHFLVEALRNRTTTLGEAQFSVLPFYQGCYLHYLQQNTFQKLAETVEFGETRLASVDQIGMEELVIPFTHDFGSCTGWWPRLGDVIGRRPPSPMHQSIAWQVNGDYNTRCVKPDRDVIIPPVSKHTERLFSLYKNIGSVEPVEKRKYLAFFAGGVRGFGAFARTRIGCGRKDQDVLSTNILYQNFATGTRYVGTLNTAKFCLLPRGIPAWTTRTFEAIYAGCIPAFVVDRNILPFQDILDYSLFSITIPENQAHQVEEILSAYSESQLISLQAHLLRIREAFLYREGHEWERKGPLFFSLVSMAMRLNLTYPMGGQCISKSLMMRDS